MLRLLPAPVRGVLTGALLGASTLFFSLLMVPPALLKLRCAMRHRYAWIEGDTALRPLPAMARAGLTR